MGRARLNMELIANEKSRMTTFRKRKVCLLKKAYELSTLCGIKVCVIISGPKLQGDRSSTELDTWPPNPDEARLIVDRYKKACAKKKHNSLRLADVLGGKQKATKESAKLSKKMYCKAERDDDHHIDQHSFDQLVALNNSIEARLKMIDMMQEAQNMRLRTGTASSGEFLSPESRQNQFFGYQQQDFFPVDEAFHKQPLNVNPLDARQPRTYPYDSYDYQMMIPPQDSTAVGSFTKMLTSSDDYCSTQYGGETSSNITWHTPIDRKPYVGNASSLTLHTPMDGVRYSGESSSSSNNNNPYSFHYATMNYKVPSFHDQTCGVILENNLMLDNRSSLMHYYVPSSWQPTMEAFEQAGKESL